MLLRVKDQEGVSTGTSTGSGWKVLKADCLPTSAGVWELLSQESEIQRLGMKQGANMVRPSSLPCLGFQNTGSQGQAGFLGRTLGESSAER